MKRTRAGSGDLNARIVGVGRGVNAREDLTLYPVHFDRGQLNSLGQRKLDLAMDDYDCLAAALQRAGRSASEDYLRALAAAEAQGLGTDRSRILHNYATIVALVEPTILLAVFALSVRVGSSDLTDIVAGTLASPAQVLSPASLLAGLFFAIHPLALLTTAWIACRADLMAT